MNWEWQSRRHCLCLCQVVVLSVLRVESLMDGGGVGRGKKTSFAKKEKEKVFLKKGNEIFTDREG